MILVWFKFVICVLLIFIFGSRLTRYGDRIASRTRLSHGLIGITFLAISTSLPEVATGLSAASKIVGVPNLCVGDIVGSIVVNLMIIALIDYKQGKGALLAEVSRSHILSGVGGIVIMSLAATFIAVRMYIPERSFSLAGMGIESFFIVISYFVILWFLLKRGLIETPTSRVEREGLSVIWAKFLGSSIVIIVVGSWLARIGQSLATNTNMTETFVGTLFLAFATSLPEIAVAFSALKIGAHDMAIGNILGSNIFNIFIIPICDAAYRRGPLLAGVNPSHIFTLILGIIMTVIAVAGIIYRTKKSFFKLGLDTLAIFLCGITGFIVLYRLP